MKLLWCWRCQQEVPMLDGEAEYLVFGQARSEGLPAVAAQAQRLGKPLPPLVLSRVAEQHRPMLEMYCLLTGFEETNPNAVRHHSANLHGPPCPHCHKPLRTQEAPFCAACGFGQAAMAGDPRPLVERMPDLFG